MTLRGRGQRPAGKVLPANAGKIPKKRLGILEGIPKHREVTSQKSEGSTWTLGVAVKTIVTESRPVVVISKNQKEKPGGKDPKDDKAKARVGTPTKRPRRTKGRAFDEVKDVPKGRQKIPCVDREGKSHWAVPLEQTA